MIFTIIVFVIVLAVIVMAHELGHLATALWMKMKIDEFGFGFPPRLWSKKAKNGIRYSLNLLPLGGFVKIKGEDGESKQDADSFGSKRIWQRAIVLVAGVAMNFLLCAVLLSIGFMFGLPQSVDQQALDQGLVKNHKIQIVAVSDDKPAKQADLQLGDSVTAIDGNQVISTQFLQDYVSARVGQTLNYEIARGDEVLNKEIEVVDIGDGKGGIGISIIETGVVSYPVHLAIYNGFKMTGLLTRDIIFAFGGIIASLFMGKGAGVQVSGPVGIAVLTGQVAQLGFIYILQFTAILSINLAIINIMPFPALDGGRLVFLAIEAIRRKPISQKIEGITNAVGFSLLMLLILVVTIQDIGRYVDFSFITNIF